MVYKFFRCRYGINRLRLEEDFYFIGFFWGECGFFFREVVGL